MMTLEGRSVPIPLCDLSHQVAPLRDAFNAAFERVLDSGTYILGAEVSSFEEEVARYLGVQYGIAVNSGTDALTIALRALRIGPGDEVVTTAFTFFATVESILQAGATPVFVDIDPETFNLDVTRVRDVLTDRTKAIVPVHLYGHAADVAPLRELALRHELFLVEDVAQAFGGEFLGEKLGTLGHAGAYSFFPSKNLGALGDGGLVVTDDDDIAELARALRAHGARRKYHNEMSGYNSRLDEVQAAFLRLKLPHVDDWNEQRRAAAARYRSLLQGHASIAVPVEKTYARHVYHQFTVRILRGNRDLVRDQLTERGIGTHIYYPIPVHRMPVFQGDAWDLPDTDSASAQVLSLPMFPGLDEEAQERVVAELVAAVESA